MLSICSSFSSSIHHSLSLHQWRTRLLLRPSLRPLARIRSSINDDRSGELLSIDADLQSRSAAPDAAKLRSWFGPNGQYIRELPCPCCRGRGYTPCTECGIERSRADCSQCSGKGIKTCRQCLGDRVIWEESIDERPWEKARSSSPVKVKEDDEVDNLEIKVDATRKSKRIYPPQSPEVSSKISRSLRSLNAKTGLFSKRMKIIHQDPMLHGQRVAAIKKAKGTAAARSQASEAMKAFFRDPENRLKRSIAMKGAKYCCSYCREEGHRRHYCPTLRETSGKIRFRCHICGERGHNRRTCGKSVSGGEKISRQSRSSHCRACGRSGHNRRTCPEVTQTESGSLNSQKVSSSPNSKRTYSCRVCMARGHNIRTCPTR